MAQDLTQWEYRYAPASAHPEVMKKLNELGEQGWEATAGGENHVILKRPKQPQQQPSRPKDDDRYYGR